MSLLLRNKQTTRQEAVLDATRPCTRCPLSPSLPAGRPLHLPHHHPARRVLALAPTPQTLLPGSSGTSTACIRGPPGASPPWPLLPARMWGSAHRCSPNTCPGSHPVSPGSLGPALAPQSLLRHQLGPRWPSRKCRCPETSSITVYSLFLDSRWPLLPCLSHRQRADDPRLYLPHPLL